MGAPDVHRAWPTSIGEISSKINFVFESSPVDFLGIWGMDRSEGLESVNFSFFPDASQDINMMPATKNPTTNQREDLKDLKVQGLSGGPQEERTIFYLAIVFLPYI